MKTIKMTNIYTNAVDLAKRIITLKENDITYDIDIVKGVNKEDIVKLTSYWPIEED